MKKTSYFILNISLGLILFSITSCLNSEKESLNIEPSISKELEKNIGIEILKKDFITTLNTHIKALENKSLEQLKPTLPKNGDVHLTLPDGKIISTTDGFITMHEQWFKEEGWNIEHEILKMENGKEFGYALIKATYREENRNGKPYLHEMFVSYDLKNENGKWVIIKDHASTIRKEPQS